MNLKDMAHRILKEKSGTASGTNGGTFCPIETRQETPRGTARTRMNTGESAKCPTVPNLYTGTVGHLAESGTAGGTASGTLAKQWGDHAHLVEWFFSAKDSLPRERFTYDRGEGWQVIWMTPAASYQNLAAEIEKGPGGQWDAEVRSILEQLHKLFGNKVYAINEYKENEQ